MAAKVRSADKVAAVLKRHPELIETFVAFGFKQLTNPIMRKTMARRVTIEQACSLRGVDMHQFLDKLNSELEKKSGDQQDPRGGSRGRTERVE